MNKKPIVKPKTLKAHKHIAELTSSHYYRMKVKVACFGLFINNIGTGWLELVQFLSTFLKLQKLIELYAKVWNATDLE